MAEDETDAGKAPSKRSKLPLLLGLVLALGGGGGGFYAVYSGMILAGESHAETGKEPGGTEAATPEPVKVSALPDVAFVPIEPLVISLNGGQGAHLRFRAQLEVKSAHKSEVEMLLPRVVDVLNGYLRAIDLADLHDNAALVRLRAQMLRRVQVVTGGDRVNDLLIMEFVLN